MYAVRPENTPFGTNYLKCHNAMDLWINHKAAQNVRLAQGTSSLNPNFKNENKLGAHRQTTNKVLKTTK